VSVGDLITRELWESVAGELRGVAGRWWDENKDHLVGLAKDEAADIFRALKRGDTFRAKQEIVAMMSPEEWRAYRDGTTEQLAGIARRRAELLDALEDLGLRAAKVLGRAVGGALGV